MPTTSMIRSVAPRVLLRPLSKPISTAYHPRCCASSLAKRFARRDATLAQYSRPLALAHYKRDLSPVRNYTAVPQAPGTTRDTALEARLQKQTLTADPGLVSLTSSVHPLTEEVGTEQKEDDTDMMAGLRHDVKVIKETFNLSEVPREAFNIGLAGVIPYLATSAGTVFCAFELNHAAHHGSVGWVMSEHTAELCLHVLEPLQVGYGAVILSFLGAIHWGLEWAKYGGYGGYKRYAIGIVAPAVAWPTILMPVEYALITQFLAFNVLYAVDSSTTTRGWTPHWYSSYRFILTAIVGTSIVLSLIGRGQVADRIGSLPSSADRVKELANSQRKKKKQKTIVEEE